MTQRWVDLDSTNASDRMTNSLMMGAVHLSDGTLVYLEFDGTNHILKYSSDHATTNTIANISATFIPVGANYALALCRDASDNIYVVGRGQAGLPFSVVVQAFTKNAGFSWTAQTAVASVANYGSFTVTLATWCNTGGGTGGAGHILICMADASNNTYVVADAGVAKAGSGTILANTGANNPTFMQGAPATLGSPMDISNDGFGNSAGLFCGASPVASTRITVGAWAISNTGALTTSINIGTYIVGTTGGARKVRVVRYAANAFAVACQGTTLGQYMIGRFSKTAQLTAFTSSGAPTSMPLNGNGLAWDMFLDPLTPNKVWIVATAAVASVKQQVYRLGCDVSTTVTFDAAATADDLLDPVNTTGDRVRAVKEPISVSAVDWQVFVKKSGTNWALYGDYTSFNTTPAVPTNLLQLSDPTDTTPVFQADVSDADIGQAVKARFKLYQNDGVTLIGTVDSATVTTSGTVSAEWAGALSVGTYKVKASAVDAAGAESVDTSFIQFFIKTSVTKDSIELWNVNQSTTKDLSLVWNVVSNNLKDLTLKWDVYQAVAPKDLVLKWNIQAKWTTVDDSPGIPTWTLVET